MGSMMEWFDFYVGALAAGLVWPVVFFSGLEAGLALGLSIVAYGITSLVRPLGAFLFGHYGDKVGRKITLFWTLTIMGAGNLLISITPSKASIGLMAPVLLAIFRVTQGIGFGGEWGSAVTLVAEFAAKSKRRALYNSALQSATGLAVLLSAGTFSLVSGLLNRSDFLDWGWRLIFVIGALVAVVGIVIRYKISESPLFVKMKEQRALAKLPAGSVLKEHWRSVLIMAWVGSCSIIYGSILQKPFSLGYMTALGVDPSFAALAVTISGGAVSITAFLGGYLADKIGRKRTLVISLAAALVSVYPFFWLINTLNPILIILAECFFAITQVEIGCYASSVTEAFPTKYRTSGVGLSYQFAGFIVGIVNVSIVPWILAGSRRMFDAGPSMAAVGSALLAGSLIAALFVKETKGADLESVSKVVKSSP
jgi:MFS family permease